MMDGLHLGADELAQVREILDRHLPSSAKVSVFGSRAGGKPKPWSDLDLIVEADEPLDLATLAALAEAFDESPLPWKVDIVDKHALEPNFSALVSAQAFKL